MVVVLTVELKYSLQVKTPTSEGYHIHYNYISMFTKKNIFLETQLEQYSFLSLRLYVILTRFLRIRVIISCVCNPRRLYYQNSLLKSSCYS